MKINITKNLSGWIPTDDDARKYHRKGKPGDIYYVEVKKYKDQRNAKLLQKYWVMLQVIVDNQENYRTKEDLHHDIKWALDITVVKQNMLTGEMIKEVGSVAFDKMENDDFNKFYSDAITLIVERVLIGTDPEELENHVMEILNFA
jgi:hypothetical protein